MGLGGSGGSETRRTLGRANRGFAQPKGPVQVWEVFMLPNVVGSPRKVGSSQPDFRYVADEHPVPWLQSAAGGDHAKRATGATAHRAGAVAEGGGATTPHPLLDGQMPGKQLVWQPTKRVHCVRTATRTRSVRIVRGAPITTSARLYVTSRSRTDLRFVQSP